jgi:putative PIN family toxin of toxin-antitoxin system
MILVIDTNVLVQALDGRHPFSRILDGWVEGRWQVALSTDISAEYEEVITRMLGTARWRKFTRLIDLMDMASNGVLHVATYFHFLTIAADRDDDKFADCAITVGADYIITSDRHFQAMVGKGYKPHPIRPEAFIERYFGAS